MELIAKTLYGLEAIAENELTALGAKNLKRLNRAVSFEGDTALLYRANLTVRSVLRILVPLQTFTAHNDRHLYQMSKKIDWEQFIGLDMTFAINSTSNSKRFRHSQYAALKVKDAIVDQFKEKHGKRPDINPRNPDVLINLHISETDVSIALDSSGESLEKRGYRTESNEAPISEALAAGMLLLSNWDKKLPLLDGMTGSGTIAIEAALLATNTPPGLHRKFGFMSWKDFDQALFDQIQEELRGSITASDVQITAYDIDARSISIAKSNARRAGVIDAITFKQQDFTESSPFAEKAIIILNPPYGERLEEDEAMPPFYHDIGFRLKHHYPGHDVWIISGNLKALKRIGLKPEVKHKLYNGPIECRFNGYTLFEGKAVDQNN